MGFIGPNGAGKSTTIKLILNLMKRDSGEINIFGKDNIAYEREVKTGLDSFWTRAIIMRRLQYER